MPKASTNLTMTIEEALTNSLLLLANNPAVIDTTTDTQVRCNNGNKLALNHPPCDNQSQPVESNHFPVIQSTSENDEGRDNRNNLPTVQPPDDTQCIVDSGNNFAGSQRAVDNQSNSASSKHDALLLVLADALDDLERVRIATDNRLRALEQVKGLGDSRESRTMQTISETLGKLEHQATLDLQRAMRAHPLGPWVKRTVGVGEKQAARLLAAIGDPADRKMPSQLWQYCGHGAPSKRQKGVKGFWNPTAKMRVHLIAESCIKQTGKSSAKGIAETSSPSRPASPYRAIYDEAREAWKDRDTTDLHKHNHALRIVGKALLLDLWKEAQELRAIEPEKTTIEPF